MTDPTEREKIAGRIRALRNKTVENGCTEDEAVSAADLAAKLLAQYNLTMDEVELRRAEFAKHSEDHEDEVGERLWKVAAAIAHLTDTTTWSSRKGVHPYRINFFGFDHEVAVAKYLLAICARAMRQEYQRLRRVYGLVNPARQRLKIIPFLDGMADSLHDRIRALKVVPPTGTGLVVVKDQLITEAMAKAGIKLQDQTKRRSRDLDESYGLGRQAGERVPLNAGIHHDDAGARKLLR